MNVRRLGYALGAEVTGIDLRKPLDGGTLASIRGAWLEHHLLCFPEQDITREHLFAFARNFGAVEGQSNYAMSDNAQIGIVTEQAINGRPWNGYKAGHNWHSDQSHTTTPSEGTFLTCKDVPDVGGDTMFANMHLAYDALSPAMQRVVEGLWAIHYRALPVRSMHQGSAEASRLARERILLVENESENGPHAIHPAVTIHPETDRRALFLSPRTRRFVGMTEAESRALMDFFEPHVVRYEFTYRHRWAVNDVIMWDNRSLLHIALADYDFEHDVRRMLRVRTNGPKSGYPYTGQDSELEAAASGQPVALVTKN